MRKCCSAVRVNLPSMTPVVGRVATGIASVSGSAIRPTKMLRSPQWAADDQKHITKEEMMTPLADDASNTKAAERQKDVSAKSATYRLIPTIPTSASDWIKIAIGMHANEIVLVKSQNGETGSVTSTSKLPVDETSTHKVSRMDCMKEGMLADVIEFSTGITGSLDPAASARWTLFGSMFTKNEPRVCVDLPVVGDEGKSIILDAVACLSIAIAKDAQNGSAWSNLGAQLAEDGIAELTLNIDGKSTVTPLICFARAVQCNPRHSNAWFNLCLQDADVRLKPTQNAPQVIVTRDQCFVKAMTLDKAESYNLFLTGKSLLELPASRGGHFTSSKPFSVEQAVVETLEGAMSGSLPHTMLDLDIISLWYFAAECLMYSVDHRYSGKASDDSKSKRLTVGGKTYTAKECLVTALEYQETLVNEHFAQHGADAGSTPFQVSPYTSLSWEQLAKLVKDDQSVVIGGKTFTAEEVFSNQFL